MKKWEANLHQVDSILYKWMKKQKKVVTNPADCIGVLEEAGIYKPKARSGLPFRNDLRKAREASGVKGSEMFSYSTKHFRFEQEVKFQEWNIYLK